MPLAGFLVCAYLWWNLFPAAKRAGLIWLVAGLLYGAWKTKGFRRSVEFIVPEEETRSAEK